MRGRRFADICRCTRWDTRQDVANVARAFFIFLEYAREHTPPGGRKYVVPADETKRLEVARLRSPTNPRKAARRNSLAVLQFGDWNTIGTRLLTRLVVLFGLTIILDYYYFKNFFRIGRVLDRISKISVITLGVSLASKLCSFFTRFTARIFSLLDKFYIKMTGNQRKYFSPVIIPCDKC